MPAHTDYLAKFARCEMAARFAPPGIADFWRSAADCYLLLADTERGTELAGEQTSLKQRNDDILQPEPTPRWLG